MSEQQRSLWELGGLSWQELGRRVWQQFWEDRIMGQAAQLSFYFLLSIFPLLLFLAALLGLLLNSDAALHDLLTQYLGAVLPKSASALIEETLQEVNEGSNAGKLSFGLLFSVWAASNGVVAIITALNIAYDVEEARPWWKRRLVALTLTAAFAVLVLGALLLMIYGGQLISWAGARLNLGAAALSAWHIAEWVLLLALVLLACNVLYVYGPNVRRRQWHWLMPGTVVALLLWLLASFGFKVYLRFADRYSLTYGSIGAVIVLLLWLYLSGAALLLGGEINSEIERASGSASQAD
jgi:membrane protein